MENVSSRIRNSDGDRLAAVNRHSIFARARARTSFYASSGINEFVQLRTPYEYMSGSREVIGCYVM